MHDAFLLKRHLKSGLSLSNLLGLMNPKRNIPFRSAKKAIVDKKAVKYRKHRNIKNKMAARPRRINRLRAA